MGAFFLIRKHQSTNVEPLSTVLCDVMEAQGFHNPIIMHTPLYDLYLYKKIVTPVDNIVTFDDGDFCACVGTIIYKGCIGKEALQFIYNDFNGLHINSEYLYGNFFLILNKNGKTYAFIDRVGVYKSYRSLDDTIWSSSFLTVLSGIKNRVADYQSIYEYVFNGSTYGNFTIIKDIHSIDPDRVYQIGNDVSYTDLENYYSNIPRYTSKEEMIFQNTSNLQNYFSNIAECFNNSIDTALSGGYDSRLILALLRKEGIKPNIHVYGKDSDYDVQIAKIIDKSENLSLNCINKEDYKRVTTKDFAEIVGKNFYAFDGYPSDGIFNNGLDLQTRKERCANGEVMINGGGGEIFRNFFSLRDRKFSVQEVVWAFYNRFDTSYCTSLFSESEYYNNMCQKILKVLHTRKTILNRYEVELLYPLFRCRYWMGRNNTINNRFGYSLTPFIDFNIIVDAAGIPIAEKNYGRFESCLIRTIDPILASYPSVYGHSFIEDPPLKRKIKDLTTIMRPIFLRKYTYRIKHRLSKIYRPYFLDEEYYKTVLHNGFLEMENFFNIEQVRDHEQFGRICTLEYLFQKYPSSS